MRTLRLHGLCDLRIHEEPDPLPAAGEALLHVKAVGLCGSDLHWFHEGGIGDARLDRPLILGHEFAGVTEEGERVAVDPSIACGQCSYCLRGDPNLCENLLFAGHGTQDGALRERMAWPRRCLFPLPDRLSDVDGLMLEPLGVALHAVDLGALQVGMTVGVFGAGPIGLLVLQLVCLAGAQSVVVTDKLPHRLDAARALGATHAIQVDSQSAGSPSAFSRTAREVAAATGGYGVDVAFEVAGENEAVETAMDAVRPGGCVILAGIPGDDRTSFSASVARRKGLTIKLVRRMKHTYPRAIRLVESSQLEVGSLVTHTFPLERAVEAFDLAAQRVGLKVAILP